jgi:hypothetical protein
MDKRSMDYLKKYSTDLQIISINDLANPAALLPASWIKVLSACEEDRVRMILDLWEPFHHQFENVLVCLRENLISLDLTCHAGGYSLMYGIKSGNHIRYYEGRNPLSKNIPERVSKYWDNLPEGLTAFYEQLHNGWYFFASESTGLAPVESWTFLGDNQWNIVEELGSLDFSLNNMLIVYGNGMGDYVSLDALKPQGESILWWHNKAPGRSIDFWTAVDTWTHLGLIN